MSRDDLWIVIAHVPRLQGVPGVAFPFYSPVWTSDIHAATPKARGIDQRSRFWKSPQQHSRADLPTDDRSSSSSSACSMPNTPISGPEIEIDQAEWEGGS